jgi:hypothetical protein
MQLRTRRRTLNKLCKDDFAFVSEFPRREKANQKKDWQAKKAVVGKMTIFDL